MCLEAPHHQLQVAVPEEEKGPGVEEDECRIADLARRASRAKMMRTLNRPMSQNIKLKLLQGLFREHMYSRQYFLDLLFFWGVTVWGI